MTAPLTDRERALCREAAARAVREVRGLDGAHDSPSDTAIAAKLYPDPAPEPGTVTTSHGKRELTDEIVRKADSAYMATPATYLTAMRAALLAVWDDIAAPAPAPAPLPERTREDAARWQWLRAVGRIRPSGDGWEAYLGGSVWDANNWAWAATMDAAVDAARASKEEKP